METSTSTATPSTASSPERFTLEALEAKSTKPAYILAAARAANRWLPGQELTREAFDDALSETERSVI